MSESTKDICSATKADVRQALKKRGADFLKKCVGYTSDTRFYGGLPGGEGVQGEIVYKLLLAEKLKAALDECREGAPGWAARLDEAMSWNSNNLLHWRLKLAFGKWLTTNPRQARKILMPLFGRKAVVARFEDVVEGLGGAPLTAHPVLRQPGAQLTLVSTLLMGLDPENFPPARSAAVEHAASALGIRFPRSSSAGARYAFMLRLLDGMIEMTRGTEHPLQNRLQAQGAIWTCYDPWLDRLPSPNGRESRAGTLTVYPTDPGSPTEAEAIIRARRGQGGFRARLLARWHVCAVTGFSHQSLLRASHLKPWRSSTELQRLDADNGLLLSPHLDALVDSHLITFENDGTMRMSKVLGEEDRHILSVHGDMKLRFVPPGTARYLAFHRANFRQLEKLR